MLNRAEASDGYEFETLAVRDSGQVIRSNTQRMQCIKAVRDIMEDI
jgi:hypothetical protein